MNESLKLLEERGCTYIICSSVNDGARTYTVIIRHPDGIVSGLFSSKNERLFHGYIATMATLYDERVADVS